MLSNLARKIECMCLENHEQQAFELSEELKELAEKSLAALEYRKTLGFIEPAG